MVALLSLMKQEMNCMSWHIAALRDGAIAH